jgi:L-ascorbate metabolism protein UlaG (beta-lactamase superfamily)
MILQYYGHSFWKITTGDTAIVIDPFDNIGYPLPQNLQAEFVFVSHDHHDHNNVSLVRGKPELIRKPGSYERKTFKAELIPVYHDDEYGSKRGRNNLIKISLEGITLVHCGDLGHLPGPDVLDRIAHPDLLLVPVGEIYTLALEDVDRLISHLQPKLVFPMHYGTPALSFRLGSLDAFTRNASSVIRHDSNQINITPELLNTPATIVLNWAKQG